MTAGVIAVIAVSLVLCAAVIVIAVLASMLRKSRGVVVDIVAREVEKTIIKTAESAKLEVMDRAEKQIKVLQVDSKESLEKKLNE